MTKYKITVLVHTPGTDYTKHTTRAFSSKRMEVTEAADTINMLEEHGFKYFKEGSDGRRVGEQFFVSEYVWGLPTTPMMDSSIADYLKAEAKRQREPIDTEKYRYVVNPSTLPHNRKRF